MNTQDYARDIRDALNYKRFSKLTHSLGDQLNSRKNRFDKSDIIERSFEVYTNYRFRWIDEEGRDHFDNDEEQYLEFKYIDGGLFTRKKKPKKTVTVKLKNSLGHNKGVTVKNHADFYIISQKDAMAMLSWKEIKLYLYSVADGIEAKIPFEALHLIFSPDDVEGVDGTKIDYQKMKSKMQMDIIKRIK